MPDTLDLAYHARLARNGILGSLNPDLHYECTFLTILDVHPAYMLHWSSMVSGVMPKYMEALPLLRAIIPDDSQGSLENGFFDAMLANMAEDGLIYDRALPERPWNVGVYYGKKDWNEDYANMAGNGRGLAGLLFQYESTGDLAWLGHARRTAERMLELAVVEGDMAWYPNPGLGNDFSYPRLSGWTTRNPPLRANEGFEGASMFYLFQPLRGFSRYYRATGDERFLDLSRRILKFGRQGKFWGGAKLMDASASAERGHFSLHFHASMAAVRGVLDHAVVANDYESMEFAYNSYSYARQTGLHRLGLFPTNQERTEGCSIADMIGMAVSLSDAGLGEHWDDVEMYTRNGLLCAQATDVQELIRVSEAGRERSPGSTWGGEFDSRFNNDNKGVLPGQEIHDRVLERSLGAFGHVEGARYQLPMMMHCCTANCSQAIYYAWEAITRSSGHSAVVNLWLNRRAPWLDVWSYLPEEGKLILHNKGMKRLRVRKPAWASGRRFRCKLNGKPIDPVWQDNYLLLDGLRGNEVVIIEVPCRTTLATYTMVNLATPQESRERYEIEFRGHTAMNVQLLEVGQHTTDRDWYRLFPENRKRRDASSFARSPAHSSPSGRLVHWSLS